MEAVRILPSSVIGAGLSDATVNGMHYRPERCVWPRSRSHLLGICSETYKIKNSPYVAPLSQDDAYPVQLLLCSVGDRAVSKLEEAAQDKFILRQLSVRIVSCLLCYFWMLARRPAGGEIRGGHMVGGTLESLSGGCVDAREVVAASLVLTSRHARPPSSGEWTLPGGKAFRKHWTGVAISQDGRKAFLTMHSPAQLWRFDFEHDGDGNKGAGFPSCAWDLRDQ
eukprot:1635545-Pyramimonas_sp.AAC.2